MKKIKEQKIFIKRVLVLLLLSLVLISIPTLVNAKENNLEQKLKVLIIEINPWLETKGMKAAEYLNMGKDTKLCVEELIEDIEYSSHGNVDVEIVNEEWLNEFCTYKSSVTLLDGSKANRFDEATWLDIMKNGWYGFWDDERVKQIAAYSFDVEYILEKFDLVERRNAGEFDQVWLVNVDPAMTYESMMVGRTAYWINGAPIIKDCDNFAVINVSISRRDANFECFGHMAENIMNRVFDSSRNSGYPSNKKQDISYEDMNLWEKFTFNKSTYTNEAEFYGVGNVHFSPNSESDYDWSNGTKVLSTWEDWLYNYPDLENSVTPTNYTAYDTNLKEPCRNHHRWWFYLFPHVSGVTDDGYSNNWWDYFVSMDYVTNVKFISSDIDVNIDEKIPKLKCKVTYQSGRTETKEINLSSNNFEIKNEKILTIQNNQLIPVKAGSTKVYYYLDGVCATANINVTEELVWLKASDWAIEELKEAKSLDIIPTILYDKDYTQSITREEFAAVCVKLYENITGKKAQSVLNNPFTDTRNIEVLKAYNLGITNGTTPTTFSPNSLITREQMATMMTRTLAKSNINTSININSIYKKFVDHNEISGWALESVYYMSTKNIIKGVGNDIFNVKGNATREQALAIAIRCVESI